MMIKSFFFSTVVLLLILLLFTATVVVCGDRRLGDAGAVCDNEWDRHPMLCRLAQELATQEQSPDDLAQELFDFAKSNGWIIDFRHGVDDAEQENSSPSSSYEQPVILRSSLSSAASQQQRQERRRTTTTRAVLPKSRVGSGTSNNHHRAVSAVTTTARLPIVLAHGMGDSCYNGGMQHVTQLLSDWLGVYAVCIPTGGSHSDDTNNGFFLNMNDSVEAFAAAVHNDTALQNGFNAVGFSQGNNVIRGYLTKHNDPIIHTFLSINGVNAGTARVPNCFDGNNRWCRFLTETASTSAYTEFAQRHSFQANYWRDVEEYAKYQQYSQLAVWNNEVRHNDADKYKTNWAKTQQFVWVMATNDELVYPAESEHWGEPIAGTANDVRFMKDTDWYKNDSFGLQTAEAAGRNAYETFVGNHLQFSLDDLERWVTTYFD